MLNTAMVGLNNPSYYFWLLIFSTQPRFTTFSDTSEAVSDPSQLAWELADFTDDVVSGAFVTILVISFLVYLIHLAMPILTFLGSF